jgi:hypothetical protein
VFVGIQIAGLTAAAALGFGWCVCGFRHS